MYICGLCRNKIRFKELNLVETEITLDENGELESASDPLVVCEYVTCGLCGASSEDGNIVDRETEDAIYGGQHEI